MKNKWPDAGQRSSFREQSRRQSTRAGVLVGVGFVAAVDEIIFHQLLAWHHFYDRSTPLIGLISDGLLHAVELLCLTAGFVALLQLRTRGRLVNSFAISGALIGIGGFQLFDGIINHKILQIHQIRYGVNTLPYDIIWNLVAMAFLFAGLWMLRRNKTVTLVRVDDVRTPDA